LKNLYPIIKKRPPKIGRVLDEWDFEQLIGTLQLDQIVINLLIKVSLKYLRAQASGIKNNNKRT